VTPRVSVIIPARNARGTLAATLDSVVAQTFEEWEAIVADDGSTDGTAELAIDFDARVSVVRSTRNLGIGGARNLALTRAAGELVALLDADDLWLPGYLDRLVSAYDLAVASGERVGIVCCDALEFDGTAPREPRALRAGEPRALRRIAGERPVTLTSLLRHNTIFISALVPRELIEYLGGFATDCLGAEDYDMWLRILEEERSALVIPEALALYRRGDSSISANEAQMARATQAVYRHALARGRLGTRQRAIAHRELRLQRLIELWDDVAKRRYETGRVPLGAVVRAAPLGVRVLIERPSRWRRWLKLRQEIFHAMSPPRGDWGAHRLEG
jgi:glycosyltransferase involved in cell wall biosynthesis